MGRFKQSLALTLILAILLALSACTPAVPAEKVVHYGVSAAWDSLMPYNSTSGSNYARLIYDKIYDRLAFNHADGTLSPRAAERWESGDDGYSVVFYLNAQSKFHDGTPVTATHWVETLRLATDGGCPTLGRSQLSVLAGTDENGVAVGELGVQAVDETTLKLTFKEKTTPENFLNDKNREFYVLPTHLLTDTASAEVMGLPLWQSPIGSGPCKFEQEISGSALTLTANADYHLGAPGFDKLSITVMDKANLLPSLIAGDLDYYAVGGNLSQDDAKLAEDAGLTVERGEVPNTFYELMLNNETLPDSGVRRAISQALDKELLCQQSTHGLGTVTATSILPTSPYAPTAGDLTRELAAAQRAVASLDRKALTLATTSARAGLAALMQQNLQEAGFEVTVETVDSATLFSGMTAGDYDLAIASHTPGVLPLWFLESRFTAGNNIFHLNEGDLMAVQPYLAALKGAGTDEEKASSGAALEEYLGAQMHFIPLWFSVALHVTSKTVTGIESSSAACSNENVWDWVKH